MLGLLDAPPVVLDDGSDRVAAPDDEDRHPGRGGVLDDVRQRLLDDPVERRLDLRGEPLVFDARLEVDVQPGLLAEGRREPLERRHQPEVVEGRRAKLDREAANALERRRDRVAHRGERGARLLGGDLLLDALQPEEDRGQRLPGLVVELPREPGSLELLRRHDPAHRVPADPLRQVDRDRSALCESLRQPEVVVGERRAGVLAVMGDDDPDRPPACDERHVESRADAEPPRCPMVDLRIVQDGVDALAPPPLEHATGLRAVECEGHADDPVCPVSVGRGDSQLTAVGKRDQDEPGVDELPQLLRDDAEERLELELRDEGVPDLVQ